MAESERRTLEEEWDEDDPDIDWECSHCGGEAYVETDDPLWDGFDAVVPCKACNGSGKAKDQVIW